MELKGEKMAIRIQKKDMKLFTKSDLIRLEIRFRALAEINTNPSIPMDDIDNAHIKERIKLLDKAIAESCEKFNIRVSRYLKRANSLEQVAVISKNLKKLEDYIFLKKMRTCLNSMQEVLKAMQSRISQD